jgi:hypothetical protein
MVLIIISKSKGIDQEYFVTEPRRWQGLSISKIVSTKPASWHLWRKDGIRWSCYLLELEEGQATVLQPDRHIWTCIDLVATKAMEFSNALDNYPVLSTQ